MGQKVNPYGLRLGIINDWRTRWYNEKEFAAYLSEDIKIRRHMIDKLSHAGLARIDIERTEQQVKIVIYAGRPGIVIGKKGAEVDKLRAHLEKLTGKRVRVDIQEVRRPEISAPLIAQNIASQLEGRVSFRRAMKKAVSQAMAGGVKGVRISSAGRLGGAEMSRTEWYREGRVPLHTLKADIEYGTAEANTKSGKIGVKVWVYLGDVPLRGLSVRHETELDISEENARPMPRPKRVIERKEPDAAPAAAKVVETAPAKVEAKNDEVAPKGEIAAGEIAASPKKRAPRNDGITREAKVEVVPVEENTASKTPAVKKPAAKKAPAEKKTTQSTTTKKTEKPVAKEAKAEAKAKPAAKKELVAKKPAAKKPAAPVTPAAKKATAAKPAIKKPAAKKTAPKKEK